jgi:hypothetical protein
MGTVTRFDHEDHDGHEYRPQHHGRRDVATRSISHLNEDRTHEHNLVKVLQDTNIFLTVRCYL